jgi:multidrug efflux pump subunit AcrB
MNLAEFAIKNRLISAIVILFSLVGGWIAYENMPRFEDPEFTIRQAQIVTSYPGASPEEVLNEVTEPLETALQGLAEVETVESVSSAGLSRVTVEIRYEYSRTKADLQVIWGKVRNKVKDVQRSLPPGAQESIVNDDFGDVYGLYYLITGEGYSAIQLRNYAKQLRDELLLVEDVANVAITGDQEEVIYVEVSRERSAALGVSLNNLYNTLAQQNSVTAAGDVFLSGERLVIQPSGDITTVEAIENLIISDSQAGGVTRLGNIASVTRGLKEPSPFLIRYDGAPAVAIGVSNVSGANVVKLGEAIDAKLRESESRRPVGIELHEYYHQGKIVDAAISDFALNVVAALVIVFVTLLVFMGFKSGVIMGITVFMTMAATLSIMHLSGIPMHRISLGALVISLGMLVDNGVVVTDGILVGVKAGRNKLEVAKEVARKNMKPLIGGTLVGIIAFAPIGFAPGATAEYTGHLFWVVMIALGLSWFFAFTLTPLLCYMWFDETAATENSEKKKEGAFFRIYKSFIRNAINARWVVVAATVAIFITAIWGFQFVKSGFFPASTSPQVVVDYWKPEGADISETNKDMTRLEDFVRGLDGVEHVQTLVGGGTLRFMLVYSFESQNSAYGQLLIKTADYNENDRIIAEIEAFLASEFPTGQGKAWRFVLGPGGGSKIEATFKGPDAAVLRRLANEAKAVMAADGGARSIKDNWRRPVSAIEPIYSESKGQRVGVSREDLADALNTNFTGKQVGVFREGDDLIPIISRAPENERQGLENINDIQILSPTTGRVVPLLQVVDGVRSIWRDGRLLREDRVLTIKAQCDPRPDELADDLLQRIKPQIEAIPLPDGYTLKWDGEAGDSSESNSDLASTIPLGFLAMVLVVVLLFNRVRQPVIIWSVVPLAIVGVVIGLVATQIPLEFIGILGLLSLSGLLIQNSLVLVDHTDNLIADGQPRFDALVESAASRLRPVTMGAFTTVLGVIPLYFDAFFKSMTVVLAFGLSFATLITLIITPVLYAIFFNIRRNETAAE